MKLLFKISNFPLVSETFILNQIVKAMDLGFDIRILVSELNNLKENADARILNKYNIEEKIVIEDYKIPANRLRRSLRAMRLLFLNLNILPSIIKYYRESGKLNFSGLYEISFYNAFKDFDVIHIQFGTNKYPVDILKKIKFLKGKIIVSYHGHDVHFPINNIIPQNGYYDRLFEIADRLVVNTPFLKDKLTDIGAPCEKIVVIPVAVNVDLFTPSLGLKKKKNREFKIITVGRLNELKGQEYGIEVVKKLVERGFEIEYTIVGTGGYENKLQSQIDRYGLRNNINMMGKKSQLEIVELLQDADIFLLTSVTNIYGMKESQGLVTAEAQACGLPIIAFDTGGVKYTIKNGITGYLVPEKNVNRMVNRVISLIRNPDKREAMGLEAVRFVKTNFSFTKVKREWEKVYL